jgi:predicted nucleic acid-binding protein
MPHVPPIQRTKKRRDKLLAAGLIEKNVWVPDIFAAELATFALELRRRARRLLPTDPDLDGQPIYDLPLPPLPTAAEIADKTKKPPRPPATKR